MARKAHHRAPAALDAAGGALPELDYEDLALTAAGMRLVRRAALDLLRRFGAVDEGEVTLALALGLFLLHVFWEERSGGASCVRASRARASTCPFLV